MPTPVFKDFPNDLSVFSVDPKFEPALLQFVL